jgi:hypothetical protein
MASKLMKLDLWKEGRELNLHPVSINSINLILFNKAVTKAAIECSIQFVEPTLRLMAIPVHLRMPHVMILLSNWHTQDHAKTKEVNSFHKCTIYSLVHNYN